MAYVQRISNQQWKRSVYFQNNSVLHRVNIKSATIFEKGYTAGVFSARAYRESGGVHLKFNIFSKCIAMYDIEGFSQNYVIWFKPETAKEISMNAYTYSHYIEPLEDSPEKRLMLAFLQQFTPVMSTNTKVIKNSYKLVNVPLDKLPGLKDNTNFRVAYSRNDNRAYIIHKNISIDTLSTFLQQFEGIPKDVYYTTLGLKDSCLGINETTTYVYLKPL